MEQRIGKEKKAVVYRMVMPEHVCPYGVKVVHLLKQKGYKVDDNHLTNREETDAFKEKHGVETTPQVFFGDERIGGYDEVRRYLGKKVLGEDDTTYVPVIAIFAVALLVALAIGFITSWSLGAGMVIPHFIASAMILLALQKVRDVESFSTMFVNYDMLARRWVPYSYMYPFAELTAGTLMLAGILPWVSIPVALFIGSVGGFSVFKAVYIEKRKIKCACVGGDTKVPLGFVSLTENLMMVGMALWMLFMMMM